MKRHLFYTALIFSLLCYMPFSFAGTEARHAETTPLIKLSGHIDELANARIYDSLSLQLKGLSREAFNYALMGFDRLLEKGSISNDSLLTIADLSQSSSHKRLYVIDLRNCRILFHSLVAHGRNSGMAMANRFSNKNESYMSSPGFYLTGTTYDGHNGYSLHLEGLEKGINDRAMERAIVIHGAPYVSDEVVRMQGYSGRSQGCPAVPPSLARPLINTIRNGSCLFIYHPSYIHRSKLLKA